MVYSRWIHELEDNKKTDRFAAHYIRLFLCEDVMAQKYSGRGPKPPVPCKHFQRGSCSQGDRCQFSHDTTVVKPRETFPFNVFWRFLHIPFLSPADLAALLETLQHIESDEILLNLVREVDSKGEKLYGPEETQFYFPILMFRDRSVTPSIYCGGLSALADPTPCR